MVLLLTEAALQVGLDLMCFKFAQQLLEDGSFTENWIPICVLFLLGVILALSNLHFINLSVKYYDATDVVPVLNAAMLLAEIGCGLVVGGERTLYNFRELMYLLVSAFVCIAGIQVLVMKTSQLSLEGDEPRSPEQDEQMQPLTGTNYTGTDPNLLRSYEAKLVKMFTAVAEEEKTARNAVEHSGTPSTRSVEESRIVT